MNRGSSGFVNPPYGMAGTGAATVGPGVPRMTISMLGAKSSGKSTYINVLYNHMASARYGYTLSAETMVRLRDSRDVEAMIGGIKIPATGAEPQEHTFILGALRNGFFIELVRIDLIDFRGEAILDLDTENSDAAWLYQRIPESDSIFVVFDATHFVAPVAPDQAASLAIVTLANHFSDRIADAFARRRAARRPPPSVAVLLSKVDVLDDQESRVGRESSAVKDEIYHLVLPIVRDMGDRAAFFPVSVGRYKSRAEGEELIEFEPRGVATPLFYALLVFLVDHRDALARKHYDFGLLCQEAEQRYRKLWRWPPFIRWLLRDAIERNQAELEHLKGELRAYGGRINEISREVKTLRQMLEQAQ